MHMFSHLRDEMHAMAGHGPQATACTGTCAAQASAAVLGRAQPATLTPTACASAVLHQGCRLKPDGIKRTLIKMALVHFRPVQKCSARLRS